jgi:hypothetical protein
MDSCKEGCSFILRPRSILYFFDTEKREVFQRCDKCGNFLGAFLIKANLISLEPEETLKVVKIPSSEK